MTDKSDPLQSESVQNFLKSIYALQQSGERVSTNAMAGMLNISAPSVTDMAQRLEEAGLVDYQKYRGVKLTPAGEEEALEDSAPPPPDRTLSGGRIRLQAA